MSLELMPPALLAYMQGNGLEMAKLIIMGPLPDGSMRYLSETTRNVPYNPTIAEPTDGTGLQTFVARTGMSMSRFVSAADLSVDNSEMTTLPAVPGWEIEGFTVEQIMAGELDAVPFKCICVCYSNLALGHFIWSAGNIGEVRLEGTALLTFEQRSLINRTKQLIVDVFSTTCRAIFGSQATQNSDGDAVVERQPCEFPVDALWVNFVVTGYDSADPDMVFYSTDLTQEDNYFHRGMVRWITGANVGNERELTQYSVDGGEGRVALMAALPYPVQIGDEGRIRPGCTKAWTGDYGCNRWWGTLKPLHFRGEPHIPVGDLAASTIPGVSVPTDIGGTGEVVTTPNPIPTPDPEPGGGGDPGDPTSRTHGATVVDPADAPFNADPTGVADSTAAFNAAIASLPGDGGIIRPSAGTYKISPTTTGKILMGSFMWLDLGTNNVTLQAAYTSQVPSPSNHKDVIQVVDDVEQVEISGGRIIGYLTAWLANGAEGVHGISEWAHGIYVGRGAHHVTIRDMSISRCVGDAVSLGRQSHHVDVDNNIFSTCRRQGISEAADDTNITNNEIFDIGGADIHGTAPKAGIDVELDDPDNYSTSNVLIQNNNIHDNQGPGIIRWRSANDVDIIDNVIAYNRNHGILGHDNSTGSIVGNTIEHNRQYGVRLESGATGYAINGNTFFNNRTALHGEITTGSSSPIDGTNATTADQLQISSDSSAVVGTNIYRPT